MWCCLLAFVLGALGGSQADPAPAPTSAQTDLTTKLNAAIKKSRLPAVYSGGGTGVMIRNPFDGFEADTSKKVLPATMWVNDIFAPSQMYPGSGGGNGNPMCSSAVGCPEDPTTHDTDPWETIQMGYVVMTNMSKLFKNFGTIQDGKPHGVFYASDANSADIRCAYFEKYHGYECPHGWFGLKGGTAPEGWTSDNSKLGAGNYEGKGCHFSGNGLNQIFAKDSKGNDLVKSHECECNYDRFRNDDNWGGWVNQLTTMSDTYRKSGGKGPTWYMDLAECWMNNPTDMIKLQNQLYWKRTQWNDQTTPQASFQQNNAASNRNYWGWNEVPVQREIITDRSNWDAVVLKLPISACGGTGDKDALHCMQPKYRTQLETQLQNWVNSNYLMPRKNSIVLAREIMDQNTNYWREFFCEAWGGEHFEIVLRTIQPQCALNIKGVNGIVV